MSLVINLPPLPPPTSLSCIAYENRHVTHSLPVFNSYLFNRIKIVLVYTYESSKSISLFKRRIEYLTKIPKYYTISKLIIRYYHEKTAHSERGMSISENRNTGHWMINCNSAVKSLIAKCIICRHLRRSISQQEIAELPRARLS